MFQVAYKINTILQVLFCLVIPDNFSNNFALDLIYHELLLTFKIILCFLFRCKNHIFYAPHSISNHSWKGKPAYKAGSPEQKQCIDYTFDGVRDLGFDAKGAVEGEIG